MAQITDVQQAIKFHQQQYLVFDDRLYNYSNTQQEKHYLLWWYNYHLRQYLRLTTITQPELNLSLKPCRPSVDSRHKKSKYDLLWFVVIITTMLLLKG